MSPPAAAVDATAGRRSAVGGTPLRGATDKKESTR